MNELPHSLTITDPENENIYLGMAIANVPLTIILEMPHSGNTYTWCDQHGDALLRIAHSKCGQYVLLVVMDEDNDCDPAKYYELLRRKRR